MYQCLTATPLCHLVIRLVVIRDTVCFLFLLILLAITAWLDNINHAASLFERRTRKPSFQSSFTSEVIYFWLQCNRYTERSVT